MGQEKVDQLYHQVRGVLEGLFTLTYLPAEPSRKAPKMESLLSEIENARQSSRALRQQLINGRPDRGRELAGEIDAELAVVQLLASRIRKHGTAELRSHRHDLVKLEIEGERLKRLVQQLRSREFPALAGSVNDFVRLNLRRARKSQGKSMKTVAAETGIPYNSYVSLETGMYNIKLDHLFRILKFLGIGIEEVWPSQGGEPDNSGIANPNPLRIRELVRLAEATGGALLVQQDMRATTLLHFGLEEGTLARLASSALRHLHNEPGLWAQRHCQPHRFHLLLKGVDPSPFVSELMRRYLLHWSET